MHRNLGSRWTIGSGIGSNNDIAKQTFVPVAHDDFPVCDEAWTRRKKHLSRPEGVFYEGVRLDVNRINERFTTALPLAYGTAYWVYRCLDPHF